MKNTIYVIGPKTIFDQRFADYQNGIGFYFEVGFSNWGAVIHSLDSQWTVLEEMEDKFDPVDLLIESVTVCNRQEIKFILKNDLPKWVLEDKI